MNTSGLSLNGSMKSASMNLVTNMN